jgi:hypothetical protein
MRHQEPISMRDPKFVSVAAKVFTLPNKYQYSGPKSVSKPFRKNISEIQLRQSKLLQRGKEIPSKPIKIVPPIKTNKHVGTTAQRKPKKVFKPKRQTPGSLTASDLWRLNRSSHKFTKTMGRKARKGRKRKHRDNKVKNNLSQYKLCMRNWKIHFHQKLEMKEKHSIAEKTFGKLLWFINVSKCTCILSIFSKN